MPVEAGNGDRLSGWDRCGRHASRHTFLDMLGAVRGETPEPRANYMKRNAERYGVDLSHLAR